jgi:hypothetical protein
MPVMSSISVEQSRILYILYSRQFVQTVRLPALRPARQRILGVEWPICDKDSLYNYICTYI